MNLRNFIAWLNKNHYKLFISGVLLALFWLIAVTQIKIIFLNSESVPYKVCLQVYNLKPEKRSLCAFDFRGRTFIKYLVGVAGDKIRHLRKTIYVGGKRVGKAKEDDRLRIISEGKIPEGYVFVAGTHEDSLDSRYEEFGLIPVSALKGKAIGLWKCE